MIIFDTNVYIDAADQAERGARMASFIERSKERVLVSSVVVAELLAGLISDSSRDTMLRDVYGHARPSVLLTPAHSDWEEAGDAMRWLGGDAVTTRRSFWNDLLIAASCARVGATLVTSNTDDFTRIKRAIPVRTVALWRN